MSLWRNLASLIYDLERRLAFKTTDIVDVETENYSKVGSVARGPAYANFAADSYVYFPKLFNPENTPFEMVFKVTTSGVLSGEEEFICSYAGTFTTEIGTDGRYWDWEYRNSIWRGSHQIDYNTTYFTKLLYTGDNYYCYYKKEGDEEWILDLTWNSSQPRDATILQLGSDTNSGGNTQYWRGVVDLKESYVKIGDEYWLDGPNAQARDYVNRGCEEIEPKVFVGGNGYFLALQKYFYFQDYHDWDIEFKYTHNTNQNNWNAIIGQDYQDYSGLTLNVRSNGDLQINLKNSGNSWIIADTSTGLTLTQGQTYYFKIGYESTENSGNYYLKYKFNEEDEWIDQWNYESSAIHYQHDQLNFLGSRYYSGSRYNTGTFYLNTLKITGNGVTLFDGETAEEGDFFVVGTPVAEENRYAYYNFNTGNYLNLGCSFDPGNRPWEWQMKFKTGTDISATQYILGCSNSNRSLLYALYNGNLCMYASSDGSNWNIMDKTPLMPISGMTTYWTRFGWDGENYYLDASLDGITYERKYTQQSSLIIKPLTTIYMGAGWDFGSNGYFRNGIFYVDESNIKIDGKTHWEYLLYPKQIGDIVTLNEGIGLSKYKWSAFNNITTTFNQFSVDAIIKKIFIDDEGNTVYRLRDIPIQKNKVKFKTKTLYDCYSNTENDVYLKHGERSVIDDYRYTNHNCLQGEDKPLWSTFGSAQNYQGWIGINLSKSYSSSEINSFEIRCAFKTGSTFTNNGRIFNDRDSYDEFKIGVENSNHSCHLAASTYITAIDSCQPDTYYKVKFIYENGTCISYYYDFNNEEWIESHIVENFSPRIKRYLSVGTRTYADTDGVCRFNGSVNLSELYIKVNDNVEFDGSKEITPSNNFNNIILKTGNLTENNKIYSDFSSGNYLRLNNTFKPEDKPWQVITGFKLTSTPSHDCPLFCKYSSNTYYGLRIHPTSAKKIYYLVSQSSGSNYIFEGSGNNVLELNVDYLLRFTFTGEKYISELSSDDGETWITDKEYTSQTTMYNWDSDTTIGYYAGKGDYFEYGTINLNKYKIYIDNELWFDGSTCEEKNKNYSIDGSPTYLYSPKQFKGGSSQWLTTYQTIDTNLANNWSIVGKYMFFGFRDGGFIGSDSQENYQGPILGTHTDRKLRMWISTNGTSWNLFDDVRSSLTLSAYKWYYIKFYFTGTEYKVDVSETGEFNGEEVNYITRESTEKAYCDPNYHLIFNGWRSSWYTSLACDVSECYIEVDGTRYKVGEAQVTSQFFEKTSNNSVAPIVIEDAKINNDNQLIINNDIYETDIEKDIVTPLSYDNIYFDSTDGNYDVNLKVNIDDFDINTEAPLTEPLKIIDKTKYFTFDLEYLNGYNTFLTISGKPYEPYELPAYFTKDMNITLTLQKQWEPFEVYTKSFWLSQDWIYKKQTIYFDIDIPADKITLYINGSCKWEYFDRSSISIEAYKEDNIHYIIEKEGYKTIEGDYRITDNLYQTSSKMINIEMIKVYKCTLVYTPNDANLEIASSNTYDQKDNWIQVYEGANVRYTVSKLGYLTQEDQILNINEDKNINVTLTEVQENNISGILDTRNVKNYNCRLYRDSNNHLIASGERNNTQFSNYTYIEGPIFPVKDAKSWEYQTTYRYKGGGTYALIAGPSKTSWKQGAFNFYTRDNKFRLDFPTNDEYYYISDQNLNITPESGYEYKFKIGQILEHNDWIDYEPIVNPLYQKTDYLEINSNTSASNFYISTGLFGSDNPLENYSIEAKVRFYSVYENAIIINNWAANSYFLMAYRNTCRWHGDSNGSKDFGSISTNTDYTIKVDIQNNLLYLNDNSYSFTPGTCGTNEIRLFGGYSAASGNAFYGRIYNIKFKDSNGNIVRDYVPVMEKSTGTFGLYEKINDEFKVNEGTGTFTSGPNTIDAEGEGETSTIYVDYKKSDRNTTENIELTENGTDTEEETDYIKIEYIQSTGTQYIDTGINPDDTTVVQAKFIYTNYGGGDFIGSGSDDGDYSSFRFFRYGSYTYLDYGNGNSNRISTSFITSTTDPYEIEYGNRYLKNLENDNIVMSDSSVSFTQKQRTIHINSTNDYGIIYYVKIYKNNTLVRDLIPVKRKSDLVICMYDRVNNEFLENAGTDTFIAGPILHSNYLCKSSDNNINAWNAFNKNNESWINDTQVPSGLDPIWIKYYTPTAVKPTSFTIINDDSYNNMKNGYIEGSIDDETWETIYTIENRGQQKNLIEKYNIDTDKKYNYFKLNITERYNDYKETKREYFTENNSQLDITMKSNFFNQGLYGDNNNGIANFVYTNEGWKLNNNNVNIFDYLSYPTVKIIGSLSEADGVYNGFSSSNYITMNDLFKPTYGDTWEILYKFKLTSSGESILYSNENGSNGIQMKANVNYIFTSSGDGNGWVIDRGWSGLDLPLNEWRWLKYWYDGVNTYRIALSSTGEFNGEENIFCEVTSTRLISPGTTYTMRFGAGTPRYGGSLKGSVDLKESIVKINNNYIFNYNDFINPEINDNYKVYYSTKINTLPVISTNIKQFIIDGFPFTYSSNYIRTYTNIRDVKEFIVKNEQILENPNYVSNKNPNSKVPMSMLNSTLDQSTHYALGHIDLTETKLYVNNQLYWEADHTPGIGEPVYIVRGEGTQNEYEQYTINNIYNEFNGDLATPAEVVEYHDGYTIVKPLGYVEGDVTITSDQEDADIYTSHELPVKNLTVNVVDNNGNDIDDAVLLLETGANTSKYIKPVDKYRKIYIEQIKNQTIEFMINNKRFVLNNDNRVLNLDERINNFVYNYKNYYSYIISEDGLILEQNFNTFMEDKNVIWLAHVFKVNITNETGVTITYTIGDKSYVTTDGQIECYSKQVINYKIEKTGFETLEGTYTIPLECSTNGVYIVEYTLDPLVTLTVNSSENDSIITIESLGYEQENNTITTKQGTMTLNAEYIKYVNFVNNGCKIEDTNE